MLLSTIIIVIKYLSDLDIKVEFFFFLNQLRLLGGANFLFIITKGKKSQKNKELKHTLQDILEGFPISQGFPQDKYSALSKRRTNIGFGCK